MEWDKVNKHFAHIDLSESKEQQLIQGYERLRSIIDFKYKSVMDYGCGGGYFASWLYDSYKVNYHGYDISKRSLQAASLKNPGLMFHSDLFTVPCTDVLVCLAVIQHMTKEQLISFIRYCEIKQPKEIILQYRHGKGYNKADLIHRTRLESLEISGYDIVYRTEVNPKNKYVYQLMHRI